MLFHIFGHIDPYKSALVAEHYLGKSLCKLSLTDTCRTQENECARRSLLILKTESAAAAEYGFKYFQSLQTPVSTIHVIYCDANNQDTVFGTFDYTAE